MWFRLKEKGSKHHEFPAHHNSEAYVDAYLDVAKCDPHLQTSKTADKYTPLFRTISRSGQLTIHRMHPTDLLRMIKRRAISAGLPRHITCHTFRATGITAYLSNGGSLEHAQRIACHDSARTTKLYDRTSDTIGLDEIERIII